MSMKLLKAAVLDTEIHLTRLTPHNREFWPFPRAIIAPIA